MLKRSDQELVIFNKLDAERKREENEMRRKVGGRYKKYERLIQEDELPDVYRYEDFMAAEQGVEFEYGRGQRVKESVRYDDGLTEEQWLNVSEL